MDRRMKPDPKHVILFHSRDEVFSKLKEHPGACIVIRRCPEPYCYVWNPAEGSPIEWVVKAEDAIIWEHQGFLSTSPDSVKNRQAGGSFELILTDKGMR